MATRYKLIADSPMGKVKSIKRILDDGTISCIPKDTNNTDYQKYLEWVAEGNTAEAAD
tara:strand:+ start:1397 stop:1570 length:174 start_codon:yes stop_codon:yes gene_type:complete